MTLPILPTTMVGSFSMPGWLERLKTDNRSRLDEEGGREKKRTRQVRMPHQSFTRWKSSSPFGESGKSISSSTTASLLFSCLLEKSLSRTHLRIA